jgi:hypothetical protein
MRVFLKLAASVTLLGAATMVQAGCFRCDPILNISNAPVMSASGKVLTDAEVKSAIIRAGAALGWMMKDAGPGKITATLLIRSHSAEIEIPYTPTSYSISYKSSVNLNEGDGQIHKNYNGWIQNLTRGINAQLSAS